MLSFALQSLSIPAVNGERQFAVKFHLRSTSVESTQSDPVIPSLPLSPQDCHVLTFSSTGSVSDHLVLHPQLATGNFIIKAIWLPGSQTELAIITADFVKVLPVADLVCVSF